MNTRSWSYKKWRPWSHVGAWLFYISFVRAPVVMHMPAEWKVYSIVYVLVLIGAFYFNNSVLIPKYFKNEQYRKYAVTSAYVFLVSIVLLAMAIVFIEKYSANNVYPLYSMLVKGSVTFVVESSILVLLKAAKEWYIQSLKLREIEFQKVNFELQLLKKQLDPHFIFNTLNNIYLLVINRSENAPDAILRLSELFDYVLHDSHASKVGLAKELNFIESYIALQKMRLQKDQLVHFKTEGEVHGSVAPLVVINFIENAFKHARGVVRTESSTYYIYITIGIDDDNVCFTIKNGIGMQSDSKLPKSGIGLMNAERRLSMIYRNEYELNINAQNNVYSVFLKIPLYDKLPDS